MTPLRFLMLAAALAGFAGPASASLTPRPAGERRRAASARRYAPARRAAHRH